jgi:iron complex outermembrane receptor protein
MRTFWLGLGLVWIAQRLWAQDTLKTVYILEQAERVEAGFRYWSLDSAAKSYPFANLSELLAARSPAFIKQYGANGLSVPSLRGTGASHTQTYWNGLAINSPVLGQFDFSTMPATLGGQIDVLMGAAGLELGSGSFGGAINVGTKPVFDSLRQNLIGLMAGSWGLFGLNAQFLKTKNNKFRKVGLTFRRAKNDFPYLSTDKVSQNAQADFYQYNFFNDKAHRFKRGFLHRSIWISSTNRTIQQPITTNNAQREKVRDLSIRTSISYQTQTAKWTAGYFYQSYDYQNQTAKVSEYIGIHSVRVSYDKKTRLSSQNSFKTQFQSLYDQSPTIGQWRISGYMGWQHQNQRFETSLALRPEFVQNGVWTLMPAAGMLYHFSTWLKLTANLSQTYRQLSLNELLLGQNLKNENAKSAEFGANLNFRKAKIDLSVFRTHVENWIVWRPSVPIWRPENVLSVICSGFEARLLTDKMKISHASSIFAHLIYTYTRATSQGLQIIFTPEHQLKSRLEWHLSSWTFALDGIWVSKRYIQSNQQAYLPDYYVLGAWLQKKISKMFWLDLRINNANNFYYQIVPFYAMPPRNVEFSIILNNLNF